MDRPLPGAAGRGDRQGPAHSLPEPRRAPRQAGEACGAMVGAEALSCPACGGRMLTDVRRQPRPLALAGIAISGVLAGGFLGGTTNAVNGIVSPRYFVTIL